MSPVQQSFQGQNVNVDGEQSNIQGNQYNIRSHQVVFHVDRQDTRNEGEMVKSIGLKVL